jgi:hypothetical protein
MLLASCSPAIRGLIINASGQTLVLRPLSADPLRLEAGAPPTSFFFTAHSRREALIEREGCLYTYPAPGEARLPRSLRSASPSVVVVIEADMSMRIFERTRDGAQGPEILADGIPLAPSKFCGSSVSE